MPDFLSGAARPEAGNDDKARPRSNGFRACARAREVEVEVVRVAGGDSGASAAGKPTDEPRLPGVSTGTHTAEDDWEADRERGGNCTGKARLSTDSCSAVGGVRTGQDCPQAGNGKGKEAAPLCSGKAGEAGHKGKWFCVVEFVTGTSEGIAS